MIDIHLKNTWPLRKGFPEGGMLEKTAIIGSHQRLANAIGILLILKRIEHQLKKLKNYVTRNPSFPSPCLGRAPLSTPWVCNTNVSPSPSTLTPTHIPTSHLYSSPPTPTSSLPLHPTPHLPPQPRDCTPCLSLHRCVKVIPVKTYWQ